MIVSSARPSSAVDRSRSTAIRSGFPDAAMSSSVTMFNSQSYAGSGLAMWGSGDPVRGIWPSCQTWDDLRWNYPPDAAPRRRATAPLGAVTILLVVHSHGGS